MSDQWGNANQGFNAGAASFTPGAGRGGYNQGYNNYNQGYNQGYGQQQGGYNQGYNNQGYNQGYNNQGYNQGYGQQQGGYNQGYNQQQGYNQGYQGGYNRGGYNNNNQQQGGYRNNNYNNNYNNQQQQQQPAAPAPAPAPAAPATTTVDSKLTASGPKAEPIVMPKKGRAVKLVLGAKPTAATPAPASAESQAEKPASPTDAAPSSEASPVASTPAATEEKNLTAEEKKDLVRKELAKKKSGKTYVRDPRPHFSVVFCGHVDAGKSTCSGRLMADAGLVDEREMEKIKRDAVANKREGWEYAYVFDVSDEERARGKTHETGAGYFETADRRITILDAPGHKAFVPSMIGGATQAEICVLVISARTGEFEAGFDKGGQTREHVLLVRTCGVKQMIVVINKMDEMNWDKGRYDEILDRLKPFLKSNGYDEKLGNLLIMPVSALSGKNISKRLEAGVCSFYDGPSVLEYINKLELVDTRKEDDALAIPLVGAYKDEGKVFVYGKCESGSVVVGDKLQILPGKMEAIVEGITIENTELDKCYPGDNVHIRVRGIDENEIHAGYMLTSVPTTLKCVEYIQARVMVLDVKNILSANSKMMMHIHTAQEEVTIHKILATIDKRTGDVIEKEPAFVKAQDTMMVRLELERPLVIETHKEFDKLARFMLREEGKTIALGVVTKLYESTKDSMRKAGN